MARFPAATAAAIDRIKYLPIRCGDEHRFIAVWVVVVDGRVFARSWNDAKDGWARAFRRVRHGAIKIGKRVLRVRAKPKRGGHDAIEAAYAAKYTTKPNLGYVEGFREPWRRATTTEFEPI